MRPMMRSDTQPVAIISGASRGIGAAIAEHLHGRGWRLSLGMRTPTASPLSGPDVLVHHFDALDPSSEIAWRDATIARFGRIDGLVLNAGILPRMSVLEATSDAFDEVMEVNVKSPMRLAQLAWPSLEESMGRVVILSSLSGKRVKDPSAGLYGISKFALTGLAAGLRQCGKDTKVRTTAIFPGAVNTDMAGRPSAPEELVQPADLAVLVRTVLELPPTASVSEIPVHYTVEECF
jgi:NAD(P)-dependent dehydrogenase (short-subunit alcohol dehydrogenase family)